MAAIWSWLQQCAFVFGRLYFVFVSVFDQIFVIVFVFVFETPKKNAFAFAFDKTYLTLALQCATPVWLLLWSHYKGR